MKMEFFFVYFILQTYCLNAADAAPIKSVNLQTDPFYLIEKANKGVKNLEDTDIGIRKSHRHRRAVLIDEYWEWINGTVPYVFDTVKPVQSSMKNMTLDVFKHIENYTCIKFVQRTTEEDYVNITDGIGCWSYLGRTRGMQELVLQSQCENFEVITHEVLHALGFLHEHKRPDRDNYVTVNYTNIREGAASSFDIYNVTDFKGISTQGLSYDKQSVMHYSRFAFTIWSENGVVTYAQKYMTVYSNEDFDEVLSSTNGLSYLDKVRINMRYECNITITNPVEITTTTATTTTVSTATTKTTSPSVTTTKSASTSESLESSGAPISSATTVTAIQATTTAETITTTTTTSDNQVTTTNSTCGNLTSVCEWGKSEPDSSSCISTSFYTVLFLIFSVYIFV